MRKYVFQLNLVQFGAFPFSTIYFQTTMILTLSRLSYIQCWQILLDTLNWLIITLQCVDSCLRVIVFQLCVLRCCVEDAVSKAGKGIPAGVSSVPRDIPDRYIAARCVAGGLTLQFVWRQTSEMSRKRRAPLPPRPYSFLFPLFFLPPLYSFLFIYPLPLFLYSLESMISLARSSFVFQSKTNAAKS